jgi:phospholipase C
MWAIHLTDPASLEERIRMSQYRRAALAAALAVSVSPYGMMAQAASPIEHIIVIVGENHTFDNVFGGYVPRPGQTVLNLLSQDIITDEGKPGRNFDNARQRTADPKGAYSLNPTRKPAYLKLPQPDTTYATGQPGNIPDPRFPDDLVNGPFQLSRYMAFSDFPGDPVHRFFQMWQQVGSQNKKDLFVWVAETAGTGNHNDGFGTTPDDTHQGGLAMGFFNMSIGDAPFFKQMADFYAIGDNYHQAIMGGTGANFLALVTGDAAFFNDGQGNVGTSIIPPSGPWPSPGGVQTSQIEDPDPQSAGSNLNWYTEDGYRGGSYVKCADPAQPGVKPIRDYLGTINVNPNCAANTYYLVNNYNLAYLADGTLRPVSQADASWFTLPPQPASLRTIADALSTGNVSWKYYSGGRGDGSSKSTGTTADYCGICDPLTGFTTIMTTSLKDNLQDVNSLYDDIKGGTVPAVAFVRPLEQLAGHPANAVLALYENFTTNLVNMVHDQPDLWNKTAILITYDEGGGYYDTGYIQAVDFFGDGTRIPVIAVSPYAKKGFVDHTYYDHASVIKFIEWNFNLPKLSTRSRDNLPNPTQPASTYVPTNGPAIGDLRNLFDFNKFRPNAPAITPIITDQE